MNDYGRVYLTDALWGAEGAPSQYQAVIWSPTLGGGKAKEIWRGRPQLDPEVAFKEMEKAAKKMKRPVELWRHGNEFVRVAGEKKRRSA